jgi:hypothetical protein
LLRGEVGFESQAVDVKNHEHPPLARPRLQEKSGRGVRRAFTATQALKPDVPTG